MKTKILLFLKGEFKIKYLCFMLLWCYASNTFSQDSRPNFEIPNSEVVNIYSDKLGRTYKAFVKLPIDYNKKENLQKTYPVIYLNDGTYTFQVASGLTAISSRSGSIEELIIVGISWEEGESASRSRLRDYTPTKSDDFHGSETGGAESYLNYLEKELIPKVESLYRINPKERTYSGWSAGGLFGLYVLLEKPTLFSQYILISSSYWVDKHNIFAREDEYAMKNTDLIAKVFLAVGELESPGQNGTRNEMVVDQIKFVSKLKARNYNSLILESMVIPELGHQTVFPVGLSYGLRWGHSGPTPNK